MFSFILNYRAEDLAECVNALLLLEDVGGLNVHI